MAALEVDIKRLKPFEGEVATLKAIITKRDVQIPTLDQYLKRL